MDARELTKKYHDLNGQVADLQSQVEYLTQELAKLQLWKQDADIDIKMLQHDRR